MGRVTAVVCAAFDPATDEAILAVRERVRAAGVPLPDRPPHRPHFSLAAATVERERLDAVLAVAADVAERHDPVSLRLVEVGRFGRAGALWLGPAPNPSLAALQADVHAAFIAAGWPSAFGDRSEPSQWVPHCTLAVRVEKPTLRDVQGAIAGTYRQIEGTVNALATILVGGRGDVGYAPLDRSTG